MKNIIFTYAQDLSWTFIDEKKSNLSLPSSAQTSTQLQFEADLALFSFYPPPTHHLPTTNPSGQVVTQLIEYQTSTPTLV